jgi:hypothetical protein
MIIIGSGDSESGKDDLKDAPFPNKTNAENDALSTENIVDFLALDLIEVLFYLVYFVRFGKLEGENR